MSKPHPIIQTVLDAHFPGVAKPIVMEESDEIEALAHELRIRTAERDALKVLCREQETKLKNKPEMRSIVGELRIIRNLLQAGKWTVAEDKFSALLRRLDESPNQGQQ